MIRDAMLRAEAGDFPPNMSRHPKEPRHSPCRGFVFAPSDLISGVLMRYLAPRTPFQPSPSMSVAQLTRTAGEQLGDTRYLGKR
jgi:hypothetical protein